MRLIFLSLAALAVGLSCRAAEDGTLLWNLVDGLGAKNERMSSGWYNRDMTKKAVLHAMDRLFNHEWRTRLTARADSSGQLSFRGFKGRYRLTWRRADGTTETRELNLER